MLNLFQHAVTIVFFLFILQRSPRFENNTFLLAFLSTLSQYINKNMILLAPPLQEGMGEAFLAPQGAAPAPPLQEGIGEASLAPPRDVIALGIGRRLVDACALGRLCRARAPPGGGRRLVP